MSERGGACKHAGKGASTRNSQAVARKQRHEQAVRRVKVEPLPNVRTKETTRPALRSRPLDKLN